MELCKLDGCFQPIASRETKLCHKHHLRFLRNGTTELGRELVDKTKKCIKDGCKNKQQTLMGLCLKHYKEWKRQQPVDTTKRCSVCNEPVGQGCCGMCIKHYFQWKKYGDPLHYETRKYEPYGNKGTKYYRFADGRWVHKAVAEQMLGRKLKPNEIVHHINLDKLDNRESNLFVCQSNGEHLRIHRQLEHIAGELVRDGIIGFKDGKYYRNI